MDIAKGNATRYPGNGEIPTHITEHLAFLKQAKALKQAIKLLGRPAEIKIGPSLQEGEMYVVDTSKATPLYAAEEVGRILIVHRGMEDEAKTMKAALDAALEDDEE